MSKQQAAPSALPDPPEVQERVELENEKEFRVSLVLLCVVFGGVLGGLAMRFGLIFSTVEAGVWLGLAVALFIILLRADRKIAKLKRQRAIEDALHRGVEEIEKEIFRQVHG